MISIEVNEQVQKGQLERKKNISYQELSSFLNKQLDAKWANFFKNKPTISDEQKLVNCIQSNKNNDVLIEKGKEDIKELLNELNVDDLVKLYGLLGTFNNLKDNEINRLKGVEKLADKSNQFDTMSSNKAKSISVKNAASYYENMKYDISFSKMTHQQLVNLVFNKLDSISKNELKKAVEIKYFLDDKYKNQLKTINEKRNISSEDAALKITFEDKLIQLGKLDKVINAKNLLEAYKVDYANKAEEAEGLVKSSPDLKGISEYLQENLDPEFSDGHKVDIRKYTKLDKQSVKKVNNVDSFINGVLDRIDEISVEYHKILESKLEGRATAEELLDVNKQLMNVLLTRIPDILKEKLAESGLSDNRSQYLKPEFQNLIVSIFKNRQNTRKGLEDFKVGSNI